MERAAGFAAPPVQDSTDTATLVVAAEQTAEKKGTHCYSSIHTAKGPRTREGYNQPQRSHIL